MPGLRQREAGEHADGVERDEPADLGVGGDDQHDGRARPATMMPLENTSRWPRLVSWRGMKLSAGGEAGQPGEVGEAGVGGQHQDQHRAGLQGVEEHVADRRRCRRRACRPGR